MINVNYNNSHQLKENLRLAVLSNKHESEIINIVSQNNFNLETPIDSVIL